MTALPILIDGSQTPTWLKWAQVWLPFGNTVNWKLTLLSWLLLLVWIAVLVCVIFTFVYGWNAKDDRNKQDTANRYQSFATLFIWIQLWLMLVLATQWTPLTWNLFPSVARNAEQVTLLESLADTTSYTY